MQMVQDIIVQTRTEMMHHWADAPEEVAFLRHPHRHELHIALVIRVSHGDRELEFIMVKRALDAFITKQVQWREMNNRVSCEQIAVRILEWVNETYGSRSASCKVMEDGENGAAVANGPR